MLWLITICTLIAQAVALLQRDLIINGTIAPKDRYPYAVYLQDIDYSYCGGTLIAKDVVLTAAHCIPTQSDSFDNITVVISDHDLTDKELGDVIMIRENVIHPLYKVETDNDFDIALSFLERSATISSDNFISLNRNNSYPSDDTLATYLGWGVINAQGEASSTLREVDVTVMTNEKCREINGTVYNNIRLSLLEHITPSMLCTFEHGKDSCQRDSGGPLIVRSGHHTSNRDIQVGVSSWGVSCADPIFPGVASRVSYSWGFIRDNVCRKSNLPPDYFECEIDEQPILPQTAESSLEPVMLTTSIEHTSRTTSNGQKSIASNIFAAMAIGLCLFFSVSLL